jgi:hypothetical protein
VSAFLQLRASSEAGSSCFRPNRIGSQPPPRPPTTGSGVALDRQWRQPISFPDAQGSSVSVPLRLPT